MSGNARANNGGFAPVCVAVKAASQSALLEKARAALRDSSFIELRLDALPAPGEALDLLHELAEGEPATQILATCRRVSGGGGFTGSVEEQLGLLSRFAGAGARLVDIELETLEGATPESLRGFGDAVKKAGAQVLVSAHDFTKTGDPEETLRRLRDLGAPCAPAIYKVVTTAQRLTDNLRMLRFLESTAESVPLVGVCMGLAGVPSRVLALRAGALFTFGSTEDGEVTAPGQLSARLLLEQYRVAELSRATAVYGVAGNPVVHSLSPPLHNAGFKAAGLDAVYLPLHTTSIAELAEFAEGLPLKGLSVTMPWKVEILSRLDSIDPLAARIGAVNTVARRPDGSFFGTNTDSAAIVKALREHIALKGARVLLLGAGGAARAAAFALVKEGARVEILNRTPEKAFELARASGASIAETGKSGYEAVINATPAGMLGPWQNTLAVDAAMLAGVKVVFEMVYNPPKTPLTRLATQLGIAVIPGLTMFRLQGERQWELWTGRGAPREAMENALAEAVKRF